MKIEIDNSQLINDIVEKVVKRITPLFTQNHKNNDNELMTVSELANYLKVKTSWIYEKVHIREIPFHKAGKFPRFRKKHIDLWLLNPYHPDLNEYNLNHGKEVRNNERIV
ncbi:MAG: helix-turn-helix domain-containing protein [Planctomycetota bacterium]|jgi:excisionase family DNA binding protein